MGYVNTVRRTTDPLASVPRGTAISQCAGPAGSKEAPKVSRMYPS
jgi:hypothetical protein